jgi:hypothetical protein
MSRMKNRFKPNKMFVLNYRWKLKSPKHWQQISIFWINGNFLIFNLSPIKSKHRFHHFNLRNISLIRLPNWVLSLVVGIYYTNSRLRKMHKVSILLLYFLCKLFLGPIYIFYCIKNRALANLLYFFNRYALNISYISVELFSRISQVLSARKSWSMCPTLELILFMDSKPQI